MNGDKTYCQANCRNKDNCRRNPENRPFIIIKSFIAPFNQILENAGVSNIQIPDGMWFDAKRKQIVNLRESGIIDPASVAISAVTNALSIAGIVLTTECAIISKKEKQVVNEDNLI